MKRWFLNFGILMVTMVILLSILYFMSGSLEMYPTEEQIGKARIASALIGSVCVALDCVLIKLRSCEYFSQKAQ